MSPWMSPQTTFANGVPLVIPQYEYDIDPCPTCKQPVTSVQTSASANGWASVTAGPCGHSVSCTVTQYSPVDKNVFKIRIELNPAPPTPPNYLYDGGMIGSPVQGYGGWNPYQFAVGGYVGSGSSGHSTVDALLRLCPGLRDASAICPDCGTAGTVPISTLIPHINDSHKWTRERIADWLDTLPFDLSIKPPMKGTK